jgi:hypothetical protein
MLAVLGALGFENHGAIDQCEQGVILAAANIGAGVELGATLTNQDVASQNFLTTETLNAKALGYGIATVSRTTTSFLMCHLPVTSLIKR